MASSSSPSASASPFSWPSFPIGSQPDVVLSMERDEHYSGALLSRRVAEVAELPGLLGHRRAELLAPELDLIASLLYYSLALVFSRGLSSTQTLGQEYTDLVLIDDTHSMLSRKRRLAYVFLVVGLPYLSKRARLGWGNVRRAFQAFDRRAHAQAIRERMRAGGAPSAQGAAGASGAQMADLRSQMRRAWSSHGENILMCAGFAARLHLMLFYLTGRYFTFPLRLSGAHLRYNRAQGQPHARYTILGLFLALQLSAETATGLLNLLRHRWVRHAGTDAAVEDMRVPCQTADEDVGSGVNRKCALCMERVSVPSATACGHLFCWSCIIPWCQMRAECPLCRQPCQPQSIVRLYQF